jgi:acyl carrier protein
MIENEILEKIIAIIAKQVNKSPEDIKPEDRILEDLGADSLDIVELSMAVEDEFDTKIADEDLEKLHTIGDIVAYVTAKLGSSEEK